MTSSKKITDYKVRDHIDNYNFCLDHVDIKDCSKILNFEFQKSENIKRNFDTVNSNKRLSLRRCKSH
jgi:hypothetical protein